MAGTEGVPGKSRRRSTWLILVASAAAVALVVSVVVVLAPSPAPNGFQSLWSKSFAQNGQGVGVIEGGTFYTYYGQNVGLNSTHVPVQGYFAQAIDIQTGHTLWTSAPLRMVNLYSQGDAQLMAVVGNQLILGVFFAFGEIDLAAFDLATGATLRQANVTLAESAGFYPGQQVYPVYDGSVLLWALSNAISIDVQSLNLSTFTSNWVQAVPGASYPASSVPAYGVEVDLTGAVVEGELCMGEGWTGSYFGEPNGTAFCLNATTGSELWQRTVSGVSAASGLAVDPSGMWYLDNATGVLAVRQFGLSTGNSLPGFNVPSDGNVSIAAHLLSETSSELIVTAKSPWGWYQAFNAEGKPLWNTTLPSPSPAVLESSVYQLLPPYALSGNRILLGDYPVEIYAANVNYPQTLRIVDGTTGQSLWDTSQTISSSTHPMAGIQVGFYEIAQTSGPYLLYYNLTGLFCAKP